MRTTLTAFIFLGSLSGALLSSLPGVFADSIHLQNGSVIEGEVVSGSAQGEEMVVVRIGAAGHISLRGAQVVKIDPAQPGGSATAAGDFVAVKTDASGRYYGDGTYYGQVSPESNEKTLVLVVPGAGKIRLPQAHVASMTKIDAQPAPAAAAPAPSGERKIKTTHVLHLKNGRSVAGTLVATPENEPVRLQVGDLGFLSFPRGQVARVEEAEGALTLPPEAAPSQEPRREEAQVPDELREQIKREVLSELLRELMDSVLEEKLDAALPQRGRLESTLEREALEALSNDEVLAIEEAVRELSRQRSRNRVRAERHLKSMGSAALPFLRAVAHHPFNLTRRAVQRLVRDIGDLRGAPLAIAALNDPDEFVRRHAFEALAKLFPASGIAANAGASEKDRLEAQAAYWNLWEEVLRAEARQSVLEVLVKERSF